MHFKILCILLLIKTLKIDARGRIQIPMKEHSASNSNESIDLPRGFDPQPSPMNPLLYPFATEEPITTITGTTSGWRPMMRNRTTAKTPSIRPVLEDRISITSQETQQVQKAMEGTVMESIVYGTWKSERPIEPNLAQPKLSEAENENVKTDIEGATPVYKNIIRRRLGGFIEEIDPRKPIKGLSEISSSTESKEKIGNSSKKSYRKQGRRKILNFNGNKSNESQNSQNSQNSNSMEVSMMNSTYPELFNIAKQINESMETPKIAKTASTEAISNENPYAPTLRNSKEKISKEWPIDFLNSNDESNPAEDSNAQENNFNFFGDSSEPPPRSVAGVNLDELLPSTMSINITQMGIPYENQNSDEEPSICVPLSVREHSLSNPNEIVNVERVYCFPLPSSDTKRITENETVTVDKDAHFNVLNYNELSVSSGVDYVKGTISLISISFLLM